MCLLMTMVTLAHAQNVRPGDQVRFVERDQHIPAHLAPGDSRVHLRFVSGSAATVLRLNAATGWIEVRGEPLQGTQDTGWVTPPVPGQHLRRGGRSVRYVGLVSPQRLARAASQWPAAVRHLESGKSPRPRRPVDLYGGRPVRDTRGHRL